MAGPFSVYQDNTNTGMNRVGGADYYVGYAENATQARNAAAARFGDGGETNGAWTDSGNTATALAAGDLEGVVFTIEVGDDIEVSYTGVAEDAIADVGAALVTALNATDEIAGAAYAAPTLTIAETTDELGDLIVVVTVTKVVNGVTFDLTASFTENLVDGGAAEDALEVDLLAGVAPEFLAGYKRVDPN